MSDGTRTRDRLDHNQELYQLSYAHRGKLESTNGGALARRAAVTLPAEEQRAPALTAVVLTVDPFSREQAQTAGH